MRLRTASYSSSSSPNLLFLLQIESAAIVQTDKSVQDIFKKGEQASYSLEMKEVASYGLHYLDSSCSDTMLIGSHIKPQVEIMTEP